MRQSERCVCVRDVTPYVPISYIALTKQYTLFLEHGKAEGYESAEAEEDVRESTRTTF